MKKTLVLVLSLLPLFSQAQEPAAKKPSIFKKECEYISDPVQRKKQCLLDEKNKEAQEGFRSFQENSHAQRNF